MSVSQTRHSNVLVLLLSSAPGPPTPLSILVRVSLRCSVRYKACFSLVYSFNHFKKQEHINLKKPYMHMNKIMEDNTQYSLGLFPIVVLLRQDG